MTKKVFALVDCNSYYVSCERLFNPSLYNKPVIILSNNDGCAVALSKEAKAIGIKRGDPYFKIEKLLKRHGGQALSSNYALYGDISKRVMNVLRELSPRMEIYSIDEAFLDLSGLEHYDLELYGRTIKDRVFRDVGIPVSIGLGSTKVMAKVANNLAKKSARAGGVLDLSESTFQDIALERTPVSKIWGVGRRSAEKLKHLGIYNARELRDFDNDVQIQKALTKVGRQIQDELRGISCFDLEEEVEKRKQILSAKSFGSAQMDRGEIGEALASYISRAAVKLREQESICYKVSVWVTTNPFADTPQYYNSASHQFLSGVSDTRKLIEVGLDLLDEVFVYGFSYKKVGVILNDLENRYYNQLNFFEEDEDKKSEALMKVMDAINKREGSDTVKSAACGVNEKWKMLCRFKSPNFTTRWSDILKVQL